MATGILLLGLGLGCASSPRIPEAQTPEAKMFLSKCTLCHNWPHPRRHSVSEWDHYLGIMEGHMKTRGVPFSDEEKQTIRTYLHRNARQE